MRAFFALVAALALSMWVAAAGTAAAQDQSQDEQNDSMRIDVPNGADVRIQDPDNPEDILPDAPDEATGATSEDQGAVEDVIPGGQAKLGQQVLRNIVVEAGPGLSTFTSDLGNELDGGPSFAARAVIGARSPIGAEIGYFGAVNTLDTVDNEVKLELFDVNSNATVYSNSLEALGRISAFGDEAVIKPFLAGGVNYYRLDSDMARYDNADTFGLPFAAGFQMFPGKHVTVGLRAEYKFLLDLFGNDFPGGDQYGANLTVGANF